MFTLQHILRANRWQKNKLNKSDSFILNIRSNRKVELNSPNEQGGTLIEVDK